MSEILPANPAHYRPEVKSCHRHNNGHVYEVLAVALTDDEDRTEYVVLRGLHDGRVWIRTLANFNGLIGDHAIRFVPVERPQEVGDSIPDDHWPDILKHQADRLIAEAVEHNVVLTIDIVPRLPLTQGNYDMVASTRPLHSQPLP